MAEEPIYYSAVPNPLFIAPIDIHEGDELLYDFGTMELVSISRDGKVIWSRPLPEYMIDPTDWKLATGNP